MSETAEDLARRLAAELVACASSGSLNAEELRVKIQKDLTNLIGLQKSVAEAKDHTNGPAPKKLRQEEPPAAPSTGIATRTMPPTLETERVTVEEGFELTWHRPALEEVERQCNDPGTVRIFLNGCFDLMHVGHLNALRQAKSGFYQKGYKHVVMVAGIHSDAAIEGQKGAPIMTDDERIAVVRATKWVDEFVTDLPYVSMSAKMAKALRVRFICHGDDLPVVRGGDGMYSDCMEHGCFHMLKRTEAVSTTQLLERLLQRSDNSLTAGIGGSCPRIERLLPSAMATTWRLSRFAAPVDPSKQQRALKDATRVVYIDGTFDLLHGGQIRALEEAAKLGDYILVGVHDDETVHKRRGMMPILNLFERAMAVLSMYMVDDVVLGAPWQLSQEFLTTMNIAAVVRGKKPASCYGGQPAGDGATYSLRHQLPRTQGILHEVESGSELTIDCFKKRFVSQKERFAKRNSTLFQKELSYVEHREFVPEV